MTKEEATKKLQFVRNALTDSMKIAKAYDIAIEACRDMEEIEEILNCDANAEIKLKMISNVVFSKPHYFKPLEQDLKVGKWVFKNEVDRQCSIFTCSQCGEQITLFDDTLKSPQEGHYNFCPNCGYPMVGSQET